MAAVAPPLLLLLLLLLAPLARLFRLLLPGAGDAARLLLLLLLSTTAAGSAGELELAASGMSLDGWGPAPRDWLAQLSACTTCAACVCVAGVKQSCVACGGPWVCGQ